MDDPPFRLLQYHMLMILRRVAIVLRDMVPCALRGDVQGFGSIVLFKGRRVGSTMCNLFGI